MNLDRMVVRQVIAGVDWGFTNPGVINVFAVDGDKRMYQLREHYMSRKTIDWWLERAIAARDDLGVDVFACDPSEPGYIQQFVDAGLNAIKATNDILPGITAVMQRLSPAGDGRPRLLFNRDALQEQDPVLLDRKLPICTVDEIPSYVWPTKKGPRSTQERPEDHSNHGMDTVRYAVAYIDLGEDGYSESTEETLAALADYYAGWT